MALKDVSARQNGPERARRGDEALLVALAGGADVAEAARRAGVSRRTAVRRLADATFRGRVVEARSELVDRAVGQLADATTAAVRTLRDLLEAEAESVKLGAARAILDHAVKLRESSELAERIERLETLLSRPERHAQPWAAEGG